MVKFMSLGALIMTPLLLLFDDQYDHHVNEKFVMVIAMSHKNIKYWQIINVYIKNHSDLTFNKAMAIT